MIVKDIANLSTLTPNFHSEKQEFYFHGKKDRTLTLEAASNTNNRRVTVEERVSHVQEPGSNYLVHIKTESGISASTKEATIKFFEENRFDSKKLAKVRCDGAAVNTGKRPAQ